MANLPSGIVTFLFTDIEGSTRMAQHHRDKWETLRKRHHDILQSAIEAHNGYVFQIIGDAFCAAFHTAGDALQAAAKSQIALCSENWGDMPIKVRMGIHTGKAEIQENGQYHGYLAMSRIQRLMSAGHGGQVLISAATQELLLEDLPENVSLRDLGERRLKDLIRPEHIYQLVSANLPVDFPALKTLDAYRHNLPIQLTSFIAREPELALVHEYLSKDDIRLVTLIGPPGIGKTRLSIEAARASLNDFPDGVFFVALAPLDDPNLIAPTIAQSLGYVTKNLSTREQLMEGIGDKRMLLLLDNCEHLIEDVTSLASGLLTACSRLKILTTSRESLRIPGEWLYTVPAFDIPKEISSIDIENASNFHALTLFTERARAVRPDFTLNAENLKTVSTICAHLDGLPLAIELIAARIRLMSPQALLDRLSAQFVLTADGMRAASERQKTLHNAINWSYNLLPPEEQKLFAYLSVFSGGFTLEAVEAVFSQKVTEKPLPTLIASLLDKSLLKLAPDLEASSDARYTMLVTIQEYARERLREMGEETKIRNWHLAYFLALAEEGDKEMRGPNQIEWLHRLAVMRDNFRAALQWAIETRQPEAALQMARKLHWFFFVRGDHTEGRQWLGRVLALPDAPLYPEAYAEALTQLAQHTWLQTGPKEARPSVEQALAIASAHGDKENIARALAVLGLVLTFEHNFALAESALKESMVLFREVDDKWGYAHAVICLALGPYMQDDRATALALHEQALVLFREVGDRYFQGVAHRFIGNLQVKQGNLARGMAALREALMLARQLGSKWEIAAVLSSLAEVAQRAGKPARAVRLYWAAKNVFDSIGAWRQEDAAEFENDLEAFRAALGESEFAEAMEEGRAMTMEQAIAYALEESGS